MTDKQKPYKTTNFRKPRISRIVSAIVILLIVAIGWQEYVGWQTKLRESEDLLQERTSQLDAAESRLASFGNTVAKRHEQV